MPEIRQYDFSRGELDPQLHSRSDMKDWHRALRTCKNFIPDRNGSLVSRPGSRVVVQAANGCTFLRKFVASETEAYLLVFLDSALYFVRNGASLQNDGNLTTSWNDASPLYHIFSPYRLKIGQGGIASAAELAKRMQQVRYAQSGLESVFVDGGGVYPPRRLVRNGTTDWTLNKLEIGDLPDFPGVEPVAVEPLPTSDASHPAKEWVYYVTALLQDSRGVRVETKAAKVTRSILFDLDPNQEGAGGDPRAPNDAVPSALAVKIVVFPDKPFELDFSYPLNGTFNGSLLFPDGSIRTGYTWEATNIYRGRGELIGRVGRVPGIPKAGVDLGKKSSASTGGTPGRFIDYNDGENGLPNYAVAPPRGQRPFLLEYPRAVSYFDNRLCFANLTSKPHWLFCSTVNNYDDFDERVVTIEKSAAFIEIAARERQEIRSLLPMERMLVFTDLGVWAVGDDPIVGDNVNPVRQFSSVGASHLRPLVLPGVVIYTRSRGEGVVGLTYSTEAGGYNTVDVGHPSRHLFEGHYVVAWDYATEPSSILYAVRDDGKLLTYTYSPETGAAAWAIHETNGLYKDVCVVPEAPGNGKFGQPQGEDAVYVVVERTSPTGTTATYIERLASRKTSGGVADSVCLDSAVTYEGAPTTAITGLSHLNDFEVWAVADGELQGPFKVASGAITLTTAASKVHVGLKYTCDAELLDIDIEKTRGRKVTRVIADVHNTKGVKMGQTEAFLETPRIRTVADGFGTVPLRTQSIESYIRSEWNLSGRVLIRQDLPFPTTIVGVTREFEGGTK